MATLRHFMRLKSVRTALLVLFAVLLVVGVLADELTLIRIEGATL